MTSLERTLLQAVGQLEEHGIPYMVIGGFATLIWGEPRSTLDIDITVAAEDEAVVEVAGHIGRILVDDPAAFVSRARVLPVETSDGGRVDVIVATLPFELDSIARAESVEVAGRQVRICRAEDVIIHKIISSRPRDLADVEGILRRRGATLDLAFLDALAEGLARDMESPEIAERFRAAKKRAGL